MRTLASLFIVSMFLFSCGESTNLPAALACDNGIEVSLIDYSDLAGCQWMFHSDSFDRLLEPINLADFLSDPQEDKMLKISYTERPDLASVCQAGIIIELTCVE